MSRFLKGLKGLAIAFLAYVVLSKLFSSYLPLINVFSLTVIYFAMMEGEVAGAVMGSCCGLLMDSFSLGVFGIAGISNTVTGFLAGLVSKRINIVPFFKNFLFLVVMLTFEFALWMSLSFLLVSRKIPQARGIVYLTPLTSAGVGVLAFFVIKRFGRKDGK